MRVLRREERVTGLTKGQLVPRFSGHFDYLAVVGILMLIFAVISTVGCACGRGVEVDAAAGSIYARDGGAG